MAAPARPYSQQIEVNRRAWQDRDNVAAYATRALRPVEVVILARYRDALAGRVLELGCGAGRILGYLVALGGEVHGVDVAEEMVAYCRARFPGASVAVGDMRDLRGAAEAPLDAIFAPDNVLDVLDDAGRREVLAQARELLGEGGLLIFSSHNLAFADGGARSGERRAVAGLVRRAARTPPASAWDRMRRLPRQMANRRRLRPLEYRAVDHAVLNDSERDFGVLHYYVRRDDQERQLRELGFELVECLDPEGDVVAPGEPGDGAWLHYIARRR